MTWQALPWQSSLQAAFTTIWGSGVSPIPSLDLNFTLGSLDPRITYTGASLATLTNAAGAIAYKPHNLLLNSVLAGGASGSPGAAPTSWAFAFNDGSTTVGSQSVTLAVGSAGRHNIAQSFVLTPSTTYTLSFNLTAISGTAGDWFALINVSSGSISGTSFLAVSAGTGAKSLTFTSGAGGAAIDVRIGCGTNANSTGAMSVTFDSVQLNLGPLQPYYPTTSAAYYGPRFTYDPVTHAALGLLIEEQRTNLLLQSNELATTWSTFNAVTRTKNLVGIDGLTSGWTLTDSKASMGVVQQQLALGATTYTLSAYVLKTVGAQSSYPVISVDNGSTLIANATIDTSNGVATVWTTYTGWTIMTSSATCVSYNASYWRVTLTFLATATNWNINIVPAGTTNATQSTGLISSTAQGSVGVTCLQIEAFAFATSYIPTTSASVTRAADSATMTGSNFSSWFNATQGTFVTEDRPTAYSTTPIAFCVNSDNQGVTSNGDGVAQQWNGTSSLSTGNSIAAGGRRSVAMSYSAGARALCLNSGATASSASTAFGNTPTALAIGAAYAGGSQYANGPIARIRYYNTALTNAQLQALTT